MAKVGRDLYERLFRGYTRKQWALDPSQLHASVCARIPVRTNDDDRYFTDSLPADAGRRVHRDVRADARPPQHRGPHRRRLRRDRRRGAGTAGWSGPARSTASSTIATASCPTARCASSTRPGRPPGAGWPSRSPRSTIPTSGSATRESPSSVTSPVRAERSAPWPTSFPRPTAIRTIRSRARPIASCITVTRSWRSHVPTSCSSGGWRATSTSTWTRSPPPRCRRWTAGRRSRPPQCEAPAVATAAEPLARGLRSCPSLRRSARDPP